MQNEYEIKKEMCEIGKRVYNRRRWLRQTTETFL